MIGSPWFLLALLILPWLGYLLFGRSRAKPAVLFSSIVFAAQVRPSLRQRLLWLPKALLLVSVALIILGLARPRFGKERTVFQTEGIAIEMIVDRSPSMLATDFQIDEQPVDRLTAVKNVASRFVLGEGDQAGRPSDLIGLTVFSGFTDNLSPLSLDHEFMISKLRETEIVSANNEGGTAIGDALASAVEKLNSLDDGERDQIQSKVIILLTDGENNAGELDPIAAAEIAQAMGIKVYTIGVGSASGTAKIPDVDFFTGRTIYRTVNVPIDEATLTQVADITGGRYFRATDTNSLIEIYQEIDRLEKTEVETNHLTDYRELAVESVRHRSLGPLPLPPLLLMALVLLGTKLILERTWLREFS